MREYLTRQVPDSHVTYWMTTLTNDGWSNVACAADGGQVLLVFSRAVSSLEQRLEDELRYARNVWELEVGLCGLLGEVPRPTMPVVSVHCLEATDDRADELHVQLWLGDQEFDRASFTASPDQWEGEPLWRIFQCADNGLDIYKISTSDIHHCLLAEDTLLELQKVLGARIHVSASKSGRTLQIARGDEARFFFSAWGKEPKAKLALQARSDSTPPWSVMGAADRDPAALIARSIPGCSSRRVPRETPNSP